MSDDFTREEIAVLAPYVTNTARSIFVAYGLGDAFRGCMERAADASNGNVEDYPLEAQSVLPLAYRIHVLFAWNLRQLFRSLQRRSAKQGGFSYRRIAQ
jgi:hypothetical protein